MTIYSVSSSEELTNALSSAQGGDVIKLAGGDYGKLDLLTFKTFGVKAIYDSPVTIKSSDSNNPASFSGMDLREVQNLTFDSVVFDSDYTGGNVWVSPFSISDSTGITILNSLFQGELASGTGDPTIDGFATGKGLTIDGSTDVVIENNEFTTWHRAMTSGGSQGVKVLGNEIHSIRSDGVNFTSAKNILIENNYIHDFVTSSGSGDHADMIQFWTNGNTVPTTDVTIRGNTLDVGEGGGTQSIFMRNDMVDRGLAGEEMFYQNILIENNTIYNAHSHGITVGETSGLAIQNNTVLYAGSAYDEEIASVKIPKINVKSDSKSVLIEGNTTSTINGFSDQADWVVDSNALMQPFEYFQYFITSTFETENGSHDFTLIPDTLIEQLGAGSDLIQFADAPEALSPQFLVRSDAASGQSLILDASLTVGPLGVVSESDADFVWTFSDGTMAKGQIVKHGFAAPGSYDVTLTVVAEDGTKAQVQFTANIPGEDVVQFNSQTGVFEALGYGQETALDGSGLTLENTAEGYVLRLGGEGVQGAIGASEISQFFGTDKFEMTMSLKADSEASWGEVARIHSSFLASVDKAGNFVLDLFPENSSRVTVASTGISLNDGKAHDVTVLFDGQAGFAEILIDGQVVASEALSGSLGSDARSLVFGNPWGKQNFDGELSAFKLSAASYDYPIYDGAKQPISSGDTAQFESDPIDSGFEEPVNAEETPTPGTNEPTVNEDAFNEGGVQIEFAETGTLTLNHEAQTVTLQRSYDNPVVIAFVATENGGQPVNVRVSDIGDNRLTLQLQEPNYLDGRHLNETVNYMVVEAGTWVLPDGTVFEAGTLESNQLSSRDFEQVLFNAEFDSTPVILSQVQSFNGSDFVTTRQKASDTDGFKLKLQKEEALDDGEYATETLGYIAIETGGGRAGDVSWQAGSISDVTDLNATAGLGESIAGGANVIAGLSSYAGGNTAWARGNGSTDTSFDVSVEEETSADAENRHIEETISYFVFDEVGTISGTRLENLAMPQSETLQEDIPVEPLMLHEQEPPMHDEDESGLTEPLLKGGYQLDIASLTVSENVKLHDDAHVVETPDGSPAISFDGESDYVAFGRLTEFEASQKLAFSVDFTKNGTEEGGEERLVWNHSKLGLTLEGDTLIVHAANAEDHFSSGFSADGLDLNDGNRHNATVMIDAETDRLQLVVDNVVVLDEQDTDFDFVGAGGHEWGWSLGNAWNRWFEGEVHDFQVSESFEFNESATEDGTMLA